MNKVFVFGSNREGRHGKGAALYAVKSCGAIYGQPKGRQGNAYAIVTKELRFTHHPVTLREIHKEVLDFLAYAREHSDEKFILTKIGCGLAGFSEEEIKPLFADAPANVDKPEGW